MDMVEEKIGNREIDTTIVPSIISVRLLRKASIEYRPRWPVKGLSPSLDRTVHFLIQDVLRVGHPIGLIVLMQRRAT